jgi:IS5 family transposase
MERVVPWRVLSELIEPFYPKLGVSWVEWMLRSYFLQHWFNLSDPGVEEALWNSLATRILGGTSAGSVPDGTTLCRFSHLLEAHDLGRRLCDEVQRQPRD